MGRVGGGWLKGKMGPAADRREEDREGAGTRSAPDGHILGGLLCWVLMRMKVLDGEKLMMRLMDDVILSLDFWFRLQPARKECRKSCVFYATKFSSVTDRRPLGWAVRPWQMAHIGCLWYLVAQPFPLFFRFVVLG
jgi:hypothetical protein